MSKERYFIQKLIERIEASVSYLDRSSNLDNIKLYKL